MFCGMVVPTVEHKGEQYQTQLHCIVLYFSIQSFILDIYIAPLQFMYSAEVLFVLDDMMLNVAPNEDNIRSEKMFATKQTAVR